MSTVLVIGAGAIGGLLAARLALAGHEVSVVARGAHFEAMRAHGRLRLQTAAGVQDATVTAFASVAEAPDAEVVFVTLKAYQLLDLVPDLAAKAHAAEIFVPIQNGIPWWYFQRASGPHAGRVIRAVDPQGELAAYLGNARIVPAFAVVAAEVVSPGRVVHTVSAEDAFPLGPLHADEEACAQAAAALIASAGFGAPRVDVRRWVWVKLLGNIWTNPVGALSRATIAQIASDPVSRPVALALMAETQAVARAWGIEPGLDFEQRLQRAIRLRQGNKSSMLQDIERGRKTERDAILGALVELAQFAGVEVPRAHTLLACLQLLEQNLARGR